MKGAIVTRHKCTECGERYELDWSSVDEIKENYQADSAKCPLCIEGIRVAERYRSMI